jgi:hypothetical protein
MITTMNNQYDSKASKRGSALALTAFLVAGTATISLGLLITTSASGKESRGLREQQAASLAAEAGMNAAYVDFMAGGVGAVGTEANPMELGGATFFVDSVDLGDDITSLVATGVDNRSGARLQLVLRRTVEVTPLFAAFGDEGVSMDSNAFVDSYDSSDGDYASQRTNGSGNDRFANENGNVGSNANIGLRSNSGIHGDATPGPGGSVSIVGNAEVSGATAAAAATQDMPPLEIPSGTSSGNFSLSGTGSLGPGTFFFDEFELTSNSTLNVTGPITLVVGSATLNSNAEMWIDATNGGAEIFVMDDFIMDSNTMMSATSFDPADLTLNLNSDNVIDPDSEVDLDAVDFDSNAKMYGTIYAPNAYVEINSNFELFGAVVARRVHLDSNSQVHFDENLMSADDNAEPTVETLFWRELPYTSTGQQYMPGLEPTEESAWQEYEGH